MGFSPVVGSRSSIGLSVWKALLLMVSVVRLFNSDQVTVSGLPADDPTGCAIMSDGNGLSTSTEFTCRGDELQSCKVSRHWQPRVACYGDKSLIEASKKDNTTPNMNVGSMRLVTVEQQQQITKTNEEWNGSTPRSYCHPLRIWAYIGDFKVCALVDTGSDYDAIDAATSRVLQERKCKGFRKWEAIATQNVRGFSNLLEQTTKGRSRWTVTLTGSPTLRKDKVITNNYTTWFHEFEGLGDPMLFGMPTIDTFGGFDVMADKIWFNNLWIDRHIGGKLVIRDKSMSSMSLAEVPYQGVSTRSGCMALPTNITLDDGGWYPVKTYWDAARMLELASNNQPLWVEADHSDIEVVNTLVTPAMGGNGDYFEMDVLVKAKSGCSVMLSSSDRFCQFRRMDIDGKDAVQAYLLAYRTREAEHVDPADRMETHADEVKSISALIRDDCDFTGQRLLDCDPRPVIAASRYKTAAKVDEQARLFPALQAEIAQRRKTLNEPKRDQKTAKYKQEICEKVKALKLCPDQYYHTLCENVLKPFSDRFWDDGCPAPSIKGFKAHIELKQGAEMKFRQPYRLSKFDETRLQYLYEEAEQEGKVERYELGEKPPRVCTPVIVVDKKGSLIGRKVGDYQMFNKVTVDYYYPAPEADMVLMEACGKDKHTLLDCVWGFEQIDLDEASQEICSTITPFGVWKTKKLPMGVKQGPGIYQHMQDSAFQNHFKPDGDKLCNVFFDDTHVGDHTAAEHIVNLVQVLTIARQSGIQYRLEKCVFFQQEIMLIGFLCSKEGRKPDPKKIKQLREWPPYKGCPDISSHLAFCNYLREFFGPDFSAKTKPLRAYLKKEADFKTYGTDQTAQAARAWLIEVTLESCVLVVPDWEAAAKPWQSGRPFEAFLDAADESWCIALVQRATVGGTPKIIAFVCKSFTDEATRWSAFEREFCAFKDGYDAIKKWVTGFTLFMYFDHKNIERAESVLTNRRASKKLTNWIADTQHILGSVVRVWIDGKLNIIADVGSRLPWEAAVAKHCPVPTQPILELIRLLYTSPRELEAQTAQRKKEMNVGPWQPLGEKMKAPTDATRQEAEGCDVYEPTSSLDVVTYPEAEKVEAFEYPSAEAIGGKRVRFDTAGGANVNEHSDRGPRPDNSSAASSSSGSRSKSSKRSSRTTSERGPRPDYREKASKGVPVPSDTSSWQASPRPSEVALPTDESDWGSEPTVSDNVTYSEPTDLDLAYSDTDAATSSGGISRLVQQSLNGIRYFGMSYYCLFLEVCSGSALLTQAMRCAGFNTMEPVDLITGWDLTSRAHCKQLKEKIRQWRPLYTHFAPVCRIFSIAYHHAEPETEDSAQRYQHDMILAVNVCNLASFVTKLMLFVGVENPIRSGMFKLTCYVALHKQVGFSYVELNLCMFGYRHPATDELVWKGLKILTSAPWMTVMGVTCDKRHPHTELHGGYTKASSKYPWEFCVAYAQALKASPKYLSWMHRDLPVDTRHPSFHRVRSLYLTGYWPDHPLTTMAGEFEEARILVGQGESMMAPLREGEVQESEEDPFGGAVDESAPVEVADSVRVPRSDVAGEKEARENAQKDEDYAFYINWLRELRAPATRVEYQERNNGECLYVVHFKEPITDIKDSKQKRSIQFQAYGLHHYSGGKAAYGPERAAALAFTAYASSLYDPGTAPRFGCGVLGDSGFHGDARNEFYVYSLESFMRRVTATSVDPRCETFASAEKFCWNYQVLGEEMDYKHYKCLGHSVGDTETKTPRHLEYADASLGMLKEHAESVFLHLKLLIDKLVMAEPTKRVLATIGYVNGHNVEHLPQHERMLEQVLQFYFAHSKAPMVGFQVYAKVGRLEISAEGTRLVLWHHATRAPITLKRDTVDGDRYPPIERYLQELEPGNYTLSEFANGIVFYTAKSDEVEEHRHALELQGFPVQGSMRVVGLDSSLNSFGLERGRLFQMYKIGDDTMAHMALLLHGASRVSLDGYGAHILPVWCDEDARRALLADLQVLASKADKTRPLSPAETRTYANRFQLRLLGGRLSGKTKPRQFVAPMNDDPPWSDVVYRLTIGWGIVTTNEGSKHVVRLERLELAGLEVKARTAYVEEVEYNVTLFFDQLKPVDEGDADSGRVPRPDKKVNDANSVNINGADLVSGGPAMSSIGRGFGPKFGKTDLNELGRRTGIKPAQLQEALGTLKNYRLRDGLLQYLVYSRSTGTFEHLTVIPRGDWRSHEYGGVTRRLSLRRYIVLVFHNTPMGPHRSRDRTVQAIMDAGCWWQKLYQDVQATVRICLVCRSAKDQPLVTGHQRSREYVGPFRYLIIDYVGPMNPISERGYRYMFTCACAWSGWYWAFPTVDNDSETAARCLFHHVICDIAGYPMCLGSDNALAFTEGVIQALVQTFGITNVLGTAYHPQAQSAVERPHREYNTICRTFMEEEHDWDLMASIFVWTIRTTTKLFNGHYTPYEVITGMKPRSPIDAILSTGATADKITHDRYVTELIRYLKQVHKFVDEQHALVRADAERAKLRQLGTGTSLAIGDYCLVAKPLTPGVSARFQRRNFDGVHQVVEAHGEGAEAKAYTVCDLRGKQTGLGFSQPVASDRLTPVDMLPLAQASEDRKTRIIIRRGGSDRPGVVENQSIDGKVSIKFDDADASELHDLASLQYRWL